MLRAPSVFVVVSIQFLDYRWMDTLTYDLLVDAAVLLCVLSQGAAVLLLGSVKAWTLSASGIKHSDKARTLVKVVFLLARSSVVCVGVHCRRVQEY